MNGDTTLANRLLDRERTWALLRYVAGQFRRDNCLTFAGMLTFNTLLALVPLITVITMVLAALPVADDLVLRFQALIADYLVPEKQDTIQETLFGLASQATRLSATMAIFLLFTSLMLMATVEKTFNQIWGVSTPRTLVNRFLIFWTTLTIGPILVLGSLALSSYFFSLEFLSQAPAAGPLLALARGMGPFIALAMAFFLMFMIVPNRSLSWRHAAFGAVVTAIMFELVKWAFGAYIRSFDGYQKIYDAISAVPIFILWIYLLWSVILLGASFTASLGSFRYRQRGDVYPETREFVLAYRLLGHLWRAQAAGQGRSTEALLRLEPGADDHQVQAVLEDFRLANLVRRDEEGEWLLTRDLEDVSVRELYGTGAYVWPSAAQAQGERADAWNDSLSSALKDIAPAMNTVLDQPVKSLLEQRGLADSENNISRIAE
ncbi:MAG: YihY family inner membrane protein [Pseudomonadota bacterium]